MSKQPDKNILVVQYVAKITQKLSKTFKQLNEMSVQFLKVLNPPQRNQKNRTRNKEKQRTEDLNSNLINGDQQQINGLHSRKKIKAQNRIQQAQEDVQEEVIPQKPAPKVNKKPQQKHQKKNQHENVQENKKKLKVVSHKPKAPTSSFLLFFKQQQHSIAKSYPNYGVVQLTKVAAKCWNQLSVEQKQPYQKLFEAQRKKYQEEMQKYRRQFPQQVKQKQLEKKQKKKKKAKERREKQSHKQKQKYLTIPSNNDPSLYHKITPGGGQKVKLQFLHNEIQKQEQILPRGMESYQVKNQAHLSGEDQSIEENSEQQQNSLGEDI